MKQKVIMIIAAIIAAIGSATVHGEVIGEGITIPVALTQNVSSQNLKNNSTLPLAVSQDIYDDNDQLLIPEGTPVEAKIIKARKKGVWGRQGVIEFQPTAILLDGVRIPVEAPAVKKEGHSHKKAANGWFFGTIFFIPLNIIPPLCIKGEDCILEEGTVYNTTVSETTIF